MKWTWLMVALVLFVPISNAQDSIMVYTLDDISVIDFKVDHEDVFKNLKVELSSDAIALENGLEHGLKNTMPVYFKNYSYGGVSSIDFRGTGAERTKVYWNGIPINSPSLGSFDFSLLPSFLINDAKVRFGGASIVDGGGGIGGSIQLNQSQKFNQNAIEIIGSYGSFGAYTGAVLAQFKTKKLMSDTRVIYHQADNDFSYANTYKKDSPTEKRSNNQLWRVAMQQTFSYLLSAKTSIDANFLYSYVDRHIPGNISSENAYSLQQDQLLFTQLGFNHRFSDVMFLKVRSSYQNQLNAYEQGSIDAKNKVNAWNNKIDWGANLSSKLKVNASFRYDLYFVDTYGTGMIQEQQYSLFMAADWILSKSFTFSGGLRFEGLENDLAQPMPYIGLDYDLPKKIGVIKGSVSRVFRYPTINERYWQPGGNADLNPENGWNYELSYLSKWDFSKASLDFELTGFYGLVDDWILWYPSTENSSIWQAQNLWKVNNSGFEFISGFNLDLDSKSSLSIRLLYTYNASHVVESEQDNVELSNKQLILVPKNMFFIPFKYHFKNLSTGFDFTYTGIRYTDTQNTNMLDPYSLLDFTFDYAFIMEKLSLSFRLNNIFNQSYQTYPGQPMPGINFNIQLKWQFI
jgi:iron complex outermembrane receptor protein